MLVEKWAELVCVRKLFPDLKDVFTPDAVFCLEYAHRRLMLEDRYTCTRASRVRDVLVYISNLVANHDIDINRLKHLYNNQVSRRSDTQEVLPLLEDSFEDRRNNYHLYIPPGAKKAEPKKPRRTARSRRKPDESMDDETERQTIEIMLRTFDREGVKEVFRLWDLGVSEDVINKYVQTRMRPIMDEVFSRDENREEERRASERRKTEHDIILADLKSRLEQLRREDDITNATAIFNLEREIYNLEHKRDDDEWPEVIGK